MEKCFYCKADIEQGSVVGMCRRCMHGVWGEKMSNAIVDNMEKEKASGNLELGCVGESGENICEAPAAADPVLDEQVVVAVEELEEMQSIDVINDVERALENPTGQSSFIRDAIQEVQNHDPLDDEPVLEVLESENTSDQSSQEKYSDDGERFFSD
jgi:hypothetical protein